MHEKMTGFGLVSNSRNSRYYMDPSIKNGPCRIIKRADPKKLKALREEMKHVVRKSTNLQVI